MRIKQKHARLSSVDDCGFRRNDSVCCKVKRYWTFYGEIIGIGFQFLRGFAVWLCNQILSVCLLGCRSREQQQQHQGTARDNKIYFQQSDISQLKNKSCFSHARGCSDVFSFRCSAADERGRTTGPRLHWWNVCPLQCRLQVMRNVCLRRLLTK